MPLSLYNVSVASFLQTLDAIQGVLAKGLSHAQDNGIDPEELVEARLYADMLPLRFQVQNVVFHSVGAIEAVQSGVLHLTGDRPKLDYAGLQAAVAQAMDTLRALTPEAIDEREGQVVVFETPGRRRLFAVEDFILSFTLPNFHFHAATAYGILRSRGVPVGKRDFMGPVRVTELG